MSSKTEGSLKLLRRGSLPSAKSRSRLGSEFYPQIVKQSPVKVIRADGSEEVIDKLPDVIYEPTKGRNRK
jgi:hypothetical protein